MDFDKIISSTPINKTAALVLSQNYSEGRFFNRFLKKEAIIQRLNDTKKHLTSLKTSSFTSNEERKKVVLQQMDLENQLRQMKEAIKRDKYYLSVFERKTRNIVSPDIYKKIISETKKEIYGDD